MPMTSIISYANQNFTLPDTCIRLRHVLDDPRSSIEDMARVMTVDPSLSAKVLKLANSALFRFPAQITTIAKALNIIGGEAAYNISMAETANLAFKSFTSELLNLSKFWEKSVCTGLIAQSIAQQIQQRGSERFFVMGILMNLSELVCATKLPKEYTQYIARNDSQIPLEAQRANFGFTFSACSGHILEGWQLPVNLHSAMTNLSLFENQQIKKEESILYMAATMADKLEGKTLLQNPNLNLQAVQSIGLNDYEYDIILEFAQAETSKIAQAIS